LKTAFSAPALLLVYRVDGDPFAALRQLKEKYIQRADRIHKSLALPIAGKLAAADFCLRAAANVARLIPNRYEEDLEAYNEHPTSVPL